MSRTPIITVVIPTHGRPGAAARVVRALRAQRLPDGHSFEVIVVDDGSPVPVEIAPEDAGTMRVRVVRQAQQGPAAARNAGVEASDADLVAFIDDDCEPHCDWVASLGDAARRHPGCGLGGHVVNGLGENPFSETSQLMVTFLCQYYGTGPTARFFTSNNLAFPRDALREVAGFDVAYRRAAAEDRELCDRWVTGGRRLVAVPQAVVYHAHAMTTVSFWRQHFGYGRGAWGYRRARATRTGSRVRIEPWTFYRELLLCPIRAHGWRGVGLVGLVGLAQIANALGFLVEATRARWA